MNRGILAAFVLVLGACSGPKDVTIPSDMSTWDKELAPHIKKLSDEDREKVTGYLMRAKMSEAFGGTGMPTGITIGQAIDAQTSWQTEEAARQAAGEALRKKLEQEREAHQKLLNDVVTATLLSKRELPSNYRVGRYSDYQEFNIGIENKSPKTISGVAGEISFIDVFDREVGSLNFAISERIEPGKSITWTGGRDYNQFIDEHRAVWNLDEGKYRTKFTPEMIVFEDGTRIGSTSQ